MISEIDIKDMTELYNLNNGDNFEFAEEEITTPPDAPQVSPLAIWKFIKVDGMYAQIQQAAGPISFVAAWTKVRKL